MNIPEELKYTKDHEWVKIDGNKGVIGITDFAQKELGDIVYLEIETLNQSLAKEEAFGTIEAVKTVADMYMPLSGKVLEVNNELQNSPELVNHDPYGKGWLIKIEIENEAEVDQLLDHETYRGLIQA